jgi:hypothetical protein
MNFTAQQYYDDIISHAYKGGLHLLSQVAVSSADVPYCISEVEARAVHLSFYLPDRQFVLVAEHHELVTATNTYRYWTFKLDAAWKMGTKPETKTGILLSKVGCTYNPLFAGFRTIKSDVLRGVWYWSMIQAHIGPHNISAEALMTSPLHFIKYARNHLDTGPFHFLEINWAPIKTFCGSNQHMEDRKMMQRKCKDIFWSRFTQPQLVAKIAEFYRGASFPNQLQGA